MCCWDKVKMTIREVFWSFQLNILATSTNDWKRMAANLSEKEVERLWTTYTSHLHPALVIVPSSVFVFILVTNILILITFNRLKHLHLQHYLMIGLCLADAFTRAPTAIMSWTIANGNITLSDTGCGFMGLLFAITIGNTTWMHSVISIERLVSVAMPVRHCLVVAAYNPTKLASIAISICLVLPVSKRPPLWMEFCNLQYPLFKRRYELLKIHIQPQRL